MGMQDFGVYLRERRQNDGLSQECFARRLGIDRSYLSRLETGHEHNLSHDIARRLAHELRLTMDELDALLYRGAPARMESHEVVR